MAKAASKDTDSSNDYVKNARDIAFIVAVFLYFMGWIYIYNYFKELGLPLKAVDFDLYNLLIYASNVFIYIYNYGKLYLILLLLLAIVLILWKPVTLIVGKLFPLIVIVLFPLIFFIAQKAAVKDVRVALLDQPNYFKNISFVFKEIKPGAIAAKTGKQDSILMASGNDDRANILTLNQRGKFRLLALNKEEYYVLLTNTKVTEKNYKSYIPMIYVIKKDLVEFALITK